MTRKQAIIKYLNKNGSITPMQAFSELGITKLSTVISEMIHKDGFEIEKEDVRCITRLGNAVKYKKYSWKYPFSN